MVVPALGGQGTRHHDPRTGRLSTGRCSHSACEGVAPQAAPSPAGVRDRASRRIGAAPVLPSGQHPARLRPPRPALSLTDRGRQLRQPGFRRRMATDRPAPRRRHTDAGRSTGPAAPMPRTKASPSTPSEAAWPIDPRSAPRCDSRNRRLKHRAQRHRRTRLGGAQRLPARARARTARPAAPEPR